MSGKVITGEVHAAQTVTSEIQARQTLQGNVLPTGRNGLSAYELAVKNGFEGTEEEWLESLEGKDGYTPVKGVDYFDGKDGYTPVKGVDYFDGKDGEPGKDGNPGKDGVSPVVAVEDIDGGHRVTITDKDGAKTFDVMDGAGGSGGSSADWSVNDPDAEGYVKNRTHWVEYRSITWDGNTNGCDFADWSGVGVLYKVSDYVLTEEECNAMTAVLRSSDTEVNNIVDRMVVPTDDSSAVVGVVVFKPFVGGSILFYYVSAASAVDLTAIYGFAIPSAGTYMVPVDGATEYELILAPVYRKLDENYFPDTLAKKADLQPEIIQMSTGVSIDGAVLTDSMGLGSAECRQFMADNNDIKLLVYVDDGANSGFNGEYRGYFTETTRDVYSCAWVKSGRLDGELIQFILCAEVDCQADAISVWAKSLNLSADVLTTADMDTITANVIAALPIYNGEVESV